MGNIQPKAGGQLNPQWVEWLMGWPIGWTACTELETAKFQTWCASRGFSWSAGRRGQGGPGLIDRNGGRREAGI